MTVSDAIEAAGNSGIAAIMAAIRREVDGEATQPATAPVTPVLDAGAVLPLAGDAPATPAVAGIDDTLTTLLAPLLRTWLDAHLPEIVETAVTAEIRRLTGQTE